jgi:hypothetical protein
MTSNPVPADYIARCVRRRVGLATLNRLHAQIEAERILEARHARNTRRWAWCGAAALALFICLL